MTAWPEIMKANYENVACLIALLSQIKQLTCFLLAIIILFVFLLRVKMSKFPRLL